MTLFHAVVLAVIQGITEFLPVSSTAHLVLFPWVLHWPDGGLAFDVALHVGTLAALVLYFFQTWVELAFNGLGIRYPSGVTEEQHRMDQRLFWLLVVGTIPAAIAGVLFQRIIEEKLRAPIPIAGALIVVGLIMAAVESYGLLGRVLSEVNLGDAAIIGAAQALALFPGVSRSGITIVAGLWRNMTRETAARFSFLLSMPIIAGAAVKELPELVRMQHSGAAGIPLSTIVTGIIVSAIVGYAVIALFLRYLQTRTLKLFVVYRIALGVVILLLVFLNKGFGR